VKAKTRDGLLSQFIMKEQRTKTFRFLLEVNSDWINEPIVSILLSRSKQIGENQNEKEFMPGTAECFLMILNAGDVMWCDWFRKVFHSLELRNTCLRRNSWIPWPSPRRWRSSRTGRWRLIRPVAVTLSFPVFPEMGLTRSHWIHRAISDAPWCNSVESLQFPVIHQEILKISIMKSRLN